MSNPSDLAGYLASKGIRTFRAAGQEITAHCWFCDDGDNKGKGKLYLNTESWLWDCKRCGTTGNRKTLLRHFGDEDKVEHLPGTNPAMRRKVLAESADVAADMLLANPQILEYLKDRGLSLPTILDKRFGYVPASWSLCESLVSDNKRIDLINAGVMTAQGQDFFKDRITIPYLTHGDVVQLRGKDPQGKYFTPFGDSVRLYNVDSLRDADEAMIVEGEFDTAIVEQILALSTEPRLRRIAVVGLAGAESLPEGFLDYFTECKRVFVALDADDTGKRAAIKIKDLLGSKARIVELPVAGIDWTDYLRPLTDVYPHGGHTWRDVWTLLDAAEAEGRRLFTAWDAYLQWKKVDDTVGGIPTGFTELDAWIKPGLKPGQLMIPLAKTGVGKTNFLSNIAWYNRSRPLLYISLEMTRAEIYERLRRIALFWNPLASDMEIAEMYKNLRIVDARMKPGDLVTYCDEFAEETGVRPHLAFVDYVGYFANQIQGGSPYERTTRAVMTLKEEAKFAQVGLIAPHQVSRMAEDGKALTVADARDSGAIEETADILLGLWRPSDAVDRAGVASTGVNVNLLKNRNGIKNRVAALNFSQASLVLVNKATPESRIVDDENHLIARGESYEAVRAMRQAASGKANQLRVVS